MSEREKLIEAMARTIARDAGHDPDAMMPGQSDEPWRIWRQFVGIARAVLAVIEARGAVIVPVEATDEMVSAGTYHLADHLCASEYVNGPDASVVLALAHTAFVGAFSVAVAANPYRKAK